MPSETSDDKPDVEALIEQHFPKETAGHAWLWSDHEDNTHVITGFGTPPQRAPNARHYIDARSVALALRTLTAENARLLLAVATRNSQITFFRESLNEANIESARLQKERDTVLEECCEAVIAAGFATGPAENFQELLNELLADVAALQKERNTLLEEVERLNKEMKANEAFLDSLYEASGNQP